MFAAAWPLQRPCNAAAMPRYCLAMLLPGHAMQLPAPAMLLPGPAMLLPGPAMLQPGPAMLLPGPTMLLAAPFSAAIMSIDHVTRSCYLIMLLDHVA